jgi:hypothetical protein
MSNYQVHVMREIPRKERSLVKVTRIDRGPPTALVYSFSPLVTKLLYCVCGVNVRGTLRNCGPGSSVGIATGYGLDGTGIEFRLQTQKRLSLRDYLDFLRRARWKECQHTPRRHMMGRYLDVL